MWSPAQKHCFFRACAAAGVSEGENRYSIMRYAGLPNDKQRGRPSVKHRHNNNLAYERVMACLEGLAQEQGANQLPRPARGGSWRDLAEAYRPRQVHLCRALARQAEQDFPAQFFPGFLAGFTRRMTSQDANCTDDVRGCDPCQLYRIIEGLKAWINRTRAQGWRERTDSPFPSCVEEG